MPDQVRIEGARAQFIRKLEDTSGAAIALVALCMVALLSAVALAVDVGMMVTARTEAQRVADSSAMAGAGILLSNPADSATAVSTAIAFAAQNEIREDPAVVLPEDVVVDLDSSTVAVTVHRTADRNNPLGTYFARIFGVNTVDIRAYAKAIAAPVGPASGTDCLLPIMLPDRWAESGYPGSMTYSSIDDSFDDDPEDLDDDGGLDVYVPPGHPDSTSTGFDESVIGEQIVIHKAGGGGGGLEQSWYFPWTPLDEEDQLEDGGPGANEYQARFTECLEGTYEPGDFVLTEPGAMVGPTNFGFDDLVAQDPNMEWNETENCPWRTVAEGGKEVGCDYTTPRIRPMPMFDPREAPGEGRKQVPLSNIGSVFVETPAPGNDFQAIWLGFSASAPDEATDEGETPAPIPKKVKLIE